MKMLAIAALSAVLSVPAVQAADPTDLRLQVVSVMLTQRQGACQDLPCVRAYGHAIVLADASRQDLLNADALEAAGKDTTAAFDQVAADLDKLLASVHALPWVSPARVARIPVMR